MSYFTHLHVHSQYSILDGMSTIQDLVDKCLETGMNSMAVTDHGNMFGIKEFFDYVYNKNRLLIAEIKGIERELLALKGDAADECRHRLEFEKKKIFKPIFGCEVYVAKQTSTNPEGSRLIREHKENGNGYHLILLAKNEVGYHNLCKLVSYAWIDGYYYRPRIDRSLLEKYHEGIIVLTACLAGEIPRLLYDNKYDKAKETLLWYKNLFGDDLYLELQRHKTDKFNADVEVYEKQKIVNEKIIQLSTETGVKLIATNDVHFVEEDHGEAHDRLICLSTGKKLNDFDRLHYTKQEWLKTPEEMSAIFSDIPEALANTQEVADKVEFYELKHKPIMPVFDIPEEFGTIEEYKNKFSEDDLRAEFESGDDGEGRIEKLGGLEKVYRIKLESDYLRKLTMDGAHKRYGEVIEKSVQERIDFELVVMRNMGFPGYFLIVQDFISAARNMGIFVGPGRGSAAGSVVAYCLKITDIDPLKYDLLFERFLNPDRISLPDIDVDFDDEGRYSVLDWITRKYGKERVAHIITYGTMAAKSSIKDVARVHNLPIAKSNYLAKLVPDRFPADPKTKKAPQVSLQNCTQLVPELEMAYKSGDKQIHDILKYAMQLEGTVRQIGVHACGVVIGPDDLTNFVPMAIAEDKKTKNEVLITQYEGSVIEDVGLIKMDFLGLKTLSIIKETLNNIKKSRNEDLDIDSISFDDAETYELFCEGNTIATFQFESLGMQKYLKELKPGKFEDLIAMNALYRPGPMDYIPQFINRKQGREPIVYDIPIMEKYLKETYGITVYQEQVMQLSRLLASFTRGESDTLRKAIAKKQKNELDHLKPEFISRGIKNGHDEKVLEKIWADWEKFASYAFNKSHATCYSWLAYKTAYLKAHYPAEFMAANLTHNQGDMTKIAILTAECKRMKIDILGPDVNESDLTFSVNAKGEIRFGLAALKGLGGAASEAIVKEREANGNYTSVIDFLQRINIRMCSRKCIENLGKVGAFDSLNDLKRELFDDVSFMDKLIHYGVRYQEQQSCVQISLFEEKVMDVKSMGIDIPKPTPWSHIQRLNMERDICGYYVSGHPLDKYQFEIQNFANMSIKDFKDKDPEHNPVNAKVGGLIMQSDFTISQKGKEYARITLGDYEDDCVFYIFGDTYKKYKYLLESDTPVLLNVQSTERKYYSNGQQKEKTYSVNVSEVSSLEDILEKNTKKITVRLLLSEIDKHFVKEFGEMFSSFEGENIVDFDIEVTDLSTNLSVTLTARRNVDVSAFCHAFEETYPNIYCRVNS